MNTKTIITCAVTGADDTGFKYPAVPVTPKQIAEACIGAHEAGAAIAHIHVRDPQTGKPSMALELYREVVHRIRDSGSDVIINLTTGPGARFDPPDDGSAKFGPGSNLRRPEDRIAQVLELKPDICSLDMGSLNFGKVALVNTPRHIELMASEIQKAGVLPELEVFDMGHVELAKHMLDKGVLSTAPLFQAVLGVPWGAPATTETMALFKSLMPLGARWAAFGIGRHQFPMLAQAVVLGGHVRVGLEDNLYLARGALAPNNEALVERAVKLIKLIGSEIATSAEAREILGLASKT